MRTFTLDTNCIIDIDRKRPEAHFVRALAEAHAAGTAHVAVVAISASEKQQGGSYFKTFEEFRTVLERLGLNNLHILKPMGYWGVTFYDYCLWCDDRMRVLERQIHRALFPASEFEWADHCRSRGLDPDASASGGWRNNKCDVQAMWSHIHHKRNVFVTTDRNFHKATKKPTLTSLGAGYIARPHEAINLT